MPAYLHALSHSQADKEIFFVHFCGGCYQTASPTHDIPLCFCEMQQKSSALDFTTAQRGCSLLTSDRSALGFHQLGNPNIMWHIITQLSESCKHKMVTAEPWSQRLTFFLLSLSLWKQIKVTETNIPNLQLHGVSHPVLL